MIRRVSILPLLGLVLALLFSSCHAQTLDATDKASLLTLRGLWSSMTVGNSPWDSSTANTACQTWRGIQCVNQSPTDNTLRVSTINVESEGLTGALPAVLTTFTRLMNLSLAHNSFTGVIFTNLAPLSNLISLKLNDNNLTGSVPAQIGTFLVNLETLALDQNDLSGPLPATLKNLVGLTFLNVSCNNQLSGALFSWFTSFPELRVLSAAYTKMSGVNEIPIGQNASTNPFTQYYLFSQSIYRSENLTVLDARGVWASGARLPGTLGLLSKLQEFRWACNYPVAGGDFPNITGLPNLRVLDGYMSGCDLEIPESLGNVTTLEYLKLIQGGGNAYSEIVLIPQSIGNLVNLRHLDLSYNSISNALPASMANLVLLETLDLRVNKISGPILASQLRAWKQMKYLYLTENAFDSTLPDAFDQMTKLVVLELANNHFTGNFPESITNCTELETLSLSGCSFQGALPASINNLQKLTYLILGANKFNYLPDELSQLQSLRLIGLDGNHLNGTFPAPLARMSNLTGLILPGAGLTGALPDLSEMTSLKLIVLSWNHFDGGFPDHWQNLSSTLTDLQIIEANLTGPIPDWFGTFTSLTQLAICNNHLYGTIPEALIGMTSLRSLDLSRNQLSGTIPAIFGNGAPFQTIDFSHNQLNGTLPLSFNDPLGISPLLGLDLRGNHLSFCPSNITRLARMVALTGACDLSGQIDMPYDCGCLTDAFVNCTTSPQPLMHCIPCQGPPPNAEYPFECQAGVWVLISRNGTVSGGGFTVGASPVTIPGNLTVPSITYQGLPSGSVNVGGCANVQSITLNLTQADLDRLAALPAEERRKELLNMGTCDATPVPILIISPNGDKCKSITATPTTSQGTLTALFKVTDKCKGVKWWAILLGVLLGALLIVAGLGLAWYLVKRNKDKKARSTMRSRSSIEVPH